MKLPSTHNFQHTASIFLSLALELRTTSLLIPRRLEYDFPVYSSCVGPKDYGFEKHLGCIPVTK